MDNCAIFTFLQSCAQGGKRAVLVTLIAAEGASMRRPGSHMAVCEDGRWTGSLSSGCIEAAIAAEAIDALASGGPRMVRFGRGSPYIDIRLPCGGGIDLHFQPWADPALTDRALAAIDARQPFELLLPLDTGKADVRLSPPRAGDPADGYCRVSHIPNPRIVILGDGLVSLALARLAMAARIECAILSSRAEIAAEARSAGANANVLQTVRDTEALRSDPWTALLFLFHDHDWEEHLLPAALLHDRFYLGAMGSRAVHAARCEMLRKAGLADEQIAQIRAPVGLIASTRDPTTLAVSALAEIMQDFQRLTDTGGLAVQTAPQRELTR